MVEPFFSVVTQTLNCADKLAKTVASVILQSDDTTLFEYLLLDGVSNDGTSELVLKTSEQDERVRGWVEPDAGVYDAMNKALSRARGRYIYFLGAGDVLMPGVLATVARMICADQSHLSPSQAALYYGDVFWPGVGRYAGRFNIWRLTRNNICHQAIFYNRAIFERLGRFDPQYPICADWEMNLRCFGDVAIEKRYLDLVVATFEGGGLSEGEDRRFNNEFSTLIRHHLGFLPFLYARRYPHTPRAILKAIWRRVSFTPRPTE